MPSEFRTDKIVAMAMLLDADYIPAGQYFKQRKPGNPTRYFNTQGEEISVSEAIGWVFKVKRGQNNG